MFSVADAGESTKRMSRIYSSFQYGPSNAMRFSYIASLVNMDVFGNVVVYGHLCCISRMFCETSGDSSVAVLEKCSESSIPATMQSLCFLASFFGSTYQRHMNPVFMNNTICFHWKVLFNITLFALLFFTQ